jgi:hypothetical protein
MCNRPALEGGAATASFWFDVDVIVHRKPDLLFAARVAEQQQVAG